MKRRIWASALGVSLGLGGVAMGQSGDRSPAVTLGRPEPAAVLGLPVEAEPIQPAAFNNNVPRPFTPVPIPGRDGNVPALAPIAPPNGLVIGDPQTKPMPGTDGAPLPTPLPMPSGGTPSVTNPQPSGPIVQSSPGAPCTSCAPGMPGYPCSPGMAGCGPIAPALRMFGPGAYGTGMYGPGGWANRFYHSAEFLLWWTPQAGTPALAVTTPAPPVQGQPIPAQTVLFGDGVNGLFQSNRYGARFGLGFWFGPSQFRGIDANFLFLGSTTFDTTFASNAAGLPNINRPFFDQTGAPMLEIVSGNGVATGNIRIQGSSEFLGTDVNYRRGLVGGVCGNPNRIDGIVGFRYLHLNEALRITENVQSLVNPAVTAIVTDRFRTRNNFYGTQIGLLGERHLGRLSADASFKIGFGVTDTFVDIAGNQFTTGLPVDPRQGGLLALGPNGAPGGNIGTYQRSAFSVVPEVGLNIGYQLTPRLKLFMGYTFLYWSNVMRPGDQIDTTIDTNRIPNFGPVAVPTTDRPRFQDRRTDYWAQGLNFGLQYKW